MDSDKVKESETDGGETVRASVLHGAKDLRIVSSRLCFRLRDHFFDNIRIMNYFHACNISNE